MGSPLLYTGPFPGLCLNLLSIMVFSTASSGVNVLGTVMQKDLQPMTLSLYALPVRPGTLPIMAFCSLFYQDRVCHILGRKSIVF